VTLPGRILPNDVIANWPEVFGDVKLNVMPLGYVHAVLINFKNGKTWEIKITSQVKRDGWEAFEKNLSEMVKQYDSQISEVDFKLDTNKVKKDIERSTQKFLKKKKL
jgi:hypothetical protein